MSQVTCHMSISLDGFVAGHDQSADDPIGIGGKEIHKWHLRDEDATDADRDMAARLLGPRGAYVMGRNMFGPIRGEHEPVKMEGGTTFYFVTTGFDDALAQAKEVAGDQDVDIAGGASTVRQAL